MKVEDVLEKLLAVRELRATNLGKYREATSAIAFDILCAIAKGELKGKQTIERIAKIMAAADST